MPTARFSPPDVDEFELAGLTEKPSVSIRSPGIMGSYAWMECALFKIYEEVDYILVVGKVLRLEVADEALTPDGDLDVKKARPLMMTGNAKGMQFSTVTDINHFEPFGAMFPEIETCWGVVKNNIAKHCDFTMKNLIKQLDDSFKKVTKETCAKIVQKIRKIEDEFWVSDMQMDTKLTE